MSAKTGSSRISQDRKQEIEELAEAVANEYCEGLPVNPEVIAEKKGLTFSYGQYGDAFDGLLEYKEGKFHIFCNLDRVGKADSPRARFTLSHELGHYYIDEHRRTLIAGFSPSHPSSCEFESSMLVEKEADSFAANLLLPSGRFKKAARKVPRGMAGLRKLSDKFQVSLTTTVLRYVELDILPCAVVKWNWKGYAWKFLSSSAYRSYFRKTFENSNKLPVDCPTRMALGGQKAPDTGFFRSGTVASAWFPGILEDDDHNSIIIEEAISLGRFGVLTLLYRE